MATIVNQIEEVEKDIRGCEDELDMIDRRLRLKKLSDSERDGLFDRQEQIQEKLKEHDHSV